MIIQIARLLQEDSQVKLIWCIGHGWWTPASVDIDKVLDAVWELL